MKRLASIALLALNALACGGSETSPATAQPSTLAVDADANARPKGSAAATGDVVTPPPSPTDPAAAPNSACAAVAQGECHGSVAAACASIACPSEMCVATGDRPATVRCQR